MKIDNILIQRSPVHDKGVFVLHVEMIGFKFTGYFDDMPGFLTAVTDAAKFFAVRMGRISNAQARATREIADNGNKPH